MASKQFIQQTQQLADAAAAGGCGRIASEDVDDRGLRAAGCESNLLYADGRIVAGREFGGAGRKGRRSENVLHLRGDGQRMQISGAGRTHRGPRGMFGGRVVGIVGGTHCAPSAVANDFASLPAASKGTRRCDRRARPRVAGPRSLEDRQRPLRVTNRISRHGPKLVETQFDRRMLFERRHGSKFIRPGGPDNSLRASGN